MDNKLDIWVRKVQRFGSLRKSDENENKEKFLTDLETNYIKLINEHLRVRFQ